jgi:hypothetical protein
MRTIITFFLLTALAHGELITTYDSRFGQAPVGQYSSIDIGDTSIVTNPDYTELIKRLPLRSVSAPALWDTEIGIGVAITGTIEQAQADLDAAVAVVFLRLPANLDNETLIEALGADAEGITSDAAIKDVARSNRLLRARLRQDVKSVISNINVSIDVSKNAVRSKDWTNTSQAARSGQIESITKKNLEQERLLKDIAHLLLAIVKDDKAKDDEGKEAKNP